MSSQPTQNGDSSSTATTEEMVALRNKMIGSCQTFFETNPLNVVRASAQYVYDGDGNEYLDCISNVQHIGHCHPAVIDAVHRQMSLSNCNVRFLSSVTLNCARELLAKLPADLSTAIFCNSGSEANDLALRMAKQYTGATDVIVLDNAYHGHISSMVDISPYKFNHAKGSGAPPNVHVVPTPDVYRGKYRLTDAQLACPTDDAWIRVAKDYADEVLVAVERIHARGARLCAFFAESLQSCGGQVLPPPGYLRAVMQIVRDAGGVVVMDEVQTGFGRVGRQFWAFQLQGDDIIPDMVTVGKPMGNGFPVSACIARRNISEAFKNGVPYFNTFGGNPVACAASLAVLRVIRDERLQENAAVVGEHLMQRLRALQQRHACFGDVRGAGLFVGIELVVERLTRQPATALASRLISLMRANYRILLSVEGPDCNVIKIKPPICFTVQNADHLVATIDAALLKLAETD